MDKLSIGEVARRAGVRTSAIRFYEGAGLLPAPPRSSGQRRYSLSIVNRLALIRFAQEAGFTVAEIRTLFEGFDEETPMSERWQVLARQKLEEVDALIARAERMKRVLGHALACGCLRLEDCAAIIGSQHPGNDGAGPTPRNPTAGAPERAESRYNRHELAEEEL